MNKGPSSEPGGEPCTLSLSLVVYQLDSDVLSATLNSLWQALHACFAARQIDGVQVYLVDNQGQEPALRALLNEAAETLPLPSCQIRLLTGQGNVGFGAGHNLAISRARSDFHLILNPDVVLPRSTLSVALRFLQTQPDIVALNPAVLDEQGNSQFPCKRYPGVLDFLLRGFAPLAVKDQFSTRLAYYEMHDLPQQAASVGIPLLSGCFMLFRTQPLQLLGGFDDRYFLYFEDYDLSMRAHELGDLAYLPTVAITHLGGNSARKGLRHILHFGRSALRFFSTHGWRRREFG